MIRVPFLDWQPDQEDFNNKGLSVCTNTIHDADGWQQITVATVGAFSATGNLTTVSAISAKQVGTGDQNLYAWVNGNGLFIGIDGVTATSATTTPVFTTIPGIGASITAFDVCELADVIFFTVEAIAGNVAPDATETLRATGYLTYTAS